MSSGPVHMGGVREKFNGIGVGWDADYPCKLDQVGCLIQVGWNSPFHACANMLGDETAYDILTDNGRPLNLDVRYKIGKWN